MRPMFPVTRRVRRKRTRLVAGASLLLACPRISKRTVGPLTVRPPIRANGAIRPTPRPSCQCLRGGADPLGHRCFMKSAITRERGARTPTSALALVRGFVLRHDVGGNAPALIDLVTALLGPCPDLGAALAARTSTCPA